MSEEEHRLRQDEGYAVRAGNPSVEPQRGSRNEFINQHRFRF
jgi:hypothetical protein